MAKGNARYADSDSAELTTQQEGGLHLIKRGHDRFSCFFFRSSSKRALFPLPQGRGTHRRILFQDLMEYKNGRSNATRREALEKLVGPGPGTRLGY